MSSKQAVFTDVHNWLSEPEGDSYTLGIIGTFYNAIFDLFSNLVKEVRAPSNSRYSSSDIAKRYNNELRRLCLWGDGFSVEEGHLDELLARSSELTHNILSLLFQLSRVLSSELHRVVSLQENTREQNPALDMADFMRVQEQVSLFLQASDIPQMNLFSDSDSASEPQASDIVEEVYDDISTYIDCLMDLSQAIEHPAMDLFDDQDDASQHEAEVFNVTTPQALTYCRKIRDRFPHLPKYMVERLGKRNADRASYISSAELLRNQAHGLSETQEGLEDNCENRTVTDPPSESLFSSTNPHLTDATKSTQQSSGFSGSIHSAEDRKSHLVALSISGSVEQGQRHTGKFRVLPDFDDTESIATFASYSTTASAAIQGRPRVPPLPEGGDTHGTFDCPACWRELRGPMTRSQWKQHIFDDLVPYCCLYERCHAENETFQRTRTWANHLQAHVQSEDWSLFACPFCGPELQSVDRDAFLKHVSGHLREVVLAALPYTGENTDDEGNDDMSSLGGGSQDYKKEWEFAQTGDKFELDDVSLWSEGWAYSEDPPNSPDFPPPGVPLSRDLEFQDEAPGHDGSDNSSCSKTAEEGDQEAEYSEDIATPQKKRSESITRIISSHKWGLPCELQVYSRCDFSSPDRERWKMHILEHYEGRVPWHGPWDCWYCEEQFQVVDGLIGQKGERTLTDPPQLNAEKLFARLDHIAEHLETRNCDITHAKASSVSFVEWLKPKSQRFATLQKTLLCRRCGTTTETSRSGIEIERCIKCNSTSDHVVLYKYDFEDTLVIGTSCSTESFGSGDCNHNWQRAGSKTFCMNCMIVVNPNAWIHAWQHDKTDHFCWYCGVQSSMTQAAHDSINDQAAPDFANQPIHSPSRPRHDAS